MVDYHSKIEGFEVDDCGLLLTQKFICNSMFTINFYLPPDKQLPQHSGGNNSAGAKDRKRRTPYSPICGLGASVGCERSKRAFNAPRLKSQIGEYGVLRFRLPYRKIISPPHPIS